MKKWISWILILATVFALIGCSVKEAPAADTPPSAAEEPAPTTEDTAPPTEPDPIRVGVLMPYLEDDPPSRPATDADLLTWKQEGRLLLEELEKRNYEVDLQYAEYGYDDQAAQVEEMIDNGCKILVIAARYNNQYWDESLSRALHNVLHRAKKENIPVICMNGRLQYTSAQMYFVGYDWMEMGTRMGQYVVDRFDLDHAEGKTYNIEIIDDDFDHYGHTSFGLVAFYAWDYLRPYFKSGVLNCRTGIVTDSMTIESGKQYSTNSYLEPKYTYDWIKPQIAKYYTSYPLDIVIASSDTVAQGIAAALEDIYTGDTRPVLVSSGNELDTAKNIIAGKQEATIYPDCRDIVGKVVELIEALSTGAEMPGECTASYESAGYEVPGYLIETRVCTAENVRECMVDSGYHYAIQLGL